MNIFCLLLMFCFIISCKGDNKIVAVKDSASEKSISKNEDTIIDNVSKNCIEAQEKNIYEYYLCKNWNLLDDVKIKKILKSGELSDTGEGGARELHYATTESSIWIDADMTIGTKKYKLKINGGSYFYVINDKNVKSLYLCKNNRYRTSFISAIGTEDDDNYEKLKITNWSNVKSLKTDLKAWKGNYNFDNGNYEQGYQAYHIEIENNKCIFYQGDLPACKIECMVNNNGDELNLYIKSEEFKKSQYDITLVESLSEGDYLLKIIKKNNKVYVKSALIKYWNDKNSKFEKDREIETEFMMKS